MKASRIVIAAAATLAVAGALVNRAPRHLQCALLGGFVGPGLFGCWSDRQIADLLRYARPVSPELRAYASIRLVESGRLGDSKLEGELLSRAFEDAGHAVWPMPLRGERNAEAIASPRGFYLKAASAGLLDRLSLQSREAVDMLPLGQAAALAVFYRIERPAPRRAMCADVALDDPSTYLQTAVTLHAAIWGGRTNSPLVSSMQIRPLTRALASASMSCPDLTREVETLTAELAGFNDSDAAFTPTVRNHTLQDALADISQACRRCRCDQEAFARSFHRFVANQLQSPACSGSAGSPLAVAAGRLSSVPNERIASAVRKIHALRFRVGPIEYTSAQRRSVEWHSEARKLFETILSWTDADFDSRMARWHYRVLFLTDLAQLTPPSQLKTRIAEALVANIATPDSDLAPGVWFEYAKLMLRAYNAPKDRQTIREEIERARSDGLSLCLMLEGL